LATIAKQISVCCGTINGVSLNPGFEAPQRPWTSQAQPMI